jgi:hypothetical protein
MIQASIRSHDPKYACMTAILDVQPSKAFESSTAGALLCPSIMPASNAPRKSDSLLNGRVHDNDGTVHRLVNSSFGSFNDSLESIRCLIPEVHLTLPRVVVVGSRDAGKSSLLENLTKCSIFPRDKGLCTKMPTRFHLQQVQTQDLCSCAIIYKGFRTSVELTDDILSRVTSTMSEIGTFSTEELVVELKQV